MRTFVMIGIALLVAGGFAAAILYSPPRPATAPVQIVSADPWLEAWIERDNNDQTCLVAPNPSLDALDVVPSEKLASLGSVIRFAGCSLPGENYQEYESPPRRERIDSHTVKCPLGTNSAVVTWRGTEATLCTGSQTRELVASEGIVKYMIIQAEPGQELKISTTQPNRTHSVYFRITFFAKIALG